MKGKYLANKVVSTYQWCRMMSRVKSPLGAEHGMLPEEKLMENLVFHSPTLGWTSGVSNMTK